MKGSLCRRHTTSVVAEASVIESPTKTGARPSLLNVNNALFTIGQTIRGINGVAGRKSGVGQEWARVV